MKYVVIDLEMNKVSKAFADIRKIFSSEIIEIGAVALDENYCEIASFKTYVKPRYNDIIEKKIVKLTGITTDMVKNAPEFETAFKMFVSFCESLNDEYAIFEWSESDHKQIEGEMLQKNYLLDETDQKLMSHWQDFQHEFSDILGLQKRLSLVDALMYAGLDFVGEQHDALYDARNTAELLSISRVEEKRNKVIDVVKDILNPKESVVTLGDMFDFSKFMATLGA